MTTAVREGRSTTAAAVPLQCVHSVLAYAKASVLFFLAVLYNILWMPLALHRDALGILSDCIMR